MILSVSRRTDIPAFYSKWFFKRLKEGYVLVRNPMNRHQVSRIALSPKTCDCIVFWTKNPHDMIARLGELDPFNYYFQISLNPYDSEIEKNLPPKIDVIDDFKRLSEKIGRERVIWRYDPIILTDKMTVGYHRKSFEAIAKKLCGYTEKCVFSFVDLYKKTLRNMKEMPPQPITEADMRRLAKNIADTSLKYGITPQTCCEKIDLSDFSIKHGKCIDDDLIKKIAGINLGVPKDKNQREECGCVSSIDIGAYNTCKNGCVYCYANTSGTAVNNNFEKHDPDSPFLVGGPEPGDKITCRKVHSFKDNQLKFF